MTKATPLFTSTRDALSFALNANTVIMPQPGMTKAMLEGIAQGAAEITQDSLDTAARQLRLETRPPRMRGLDAAAQAGLILASFKRIDLIHQAILIGTVMQSWDPCSCRAPCCSGKRLRPAWVSAVQTLVDRITEVADCMTVPGAEGEESVETANISGKPGLRKHLVEVWLTARHLSASSIKEMTGSSIVTVAKYRAVIWHYLAQLESVAWAELDPIFDQAGIVGEP